MAALVPSTMGTLMSRGIMEGGKAIGNGDMGSWRIFWLVCREGLRTAENASWATVPSWTLWTPGQKAPRQALAEGADMGRHAAPGRRGSKGRCKATEDMLPKYGKGGRVFS